MIKRNDGISKDDICQNQFTAYVVLAVKRKRQSYIKKKQRDNEKENRTKKEAEQSEFRSAGYDMWSRMEPQNEELMSAMQQLSLTERFVVTEYALKGKPFMDDPKLRMLPIKKYENQVADSAEIGRAHV